jgi:hypothetical protein
MHEQAHAVMDPQFRDERIALAQTWSEWSRQPTPMVEAALAHLSSLTNRDTRMAYIDHISARWAHLDDAPSLAGLRALVPFALTDATILDAVLARLVGRQLEKLDDSQLAAAIQVCADDLTTGRPWDLGRGLGPGAAAMM